ALAARTAQFWTSLAGGMTPIRRWGNLQHLADRLDPVDVPVPDDIGVYFFSSRSSAAWAKKALADFRISLARRSSLTSRSRAFMRSRSLVVMPSRMTLSISLRLTQSSSVAGTQPIFNAMDSTAAHSDGYSPRCSCTRRTARPRTSGENLFCLLIVAPFSQRVEPPQNPGRFNDLSPSEVEKWVDDAKRGMENALRANPLDVKEQYERQIKDLQEAYGEAMLELRARKKLQSLLGEDEK